MGTTSSALSSVNIPFTGVSQYASDFQAELNKAVEVAQIPLTQLQSRDSVILQKQTALGTLSGAVSDLADSLKSLGALAANQALGVTSSDPNVVTASASGATTATSYTINSVTSIAIAASERTSSSYADSSSTPVSTNGTMNLIVGAKNYKFTLTSNSLIGLRDQINSLNAGVSASILTTSGGNYLSIAANNTGATTLKLYDDPDNADTPTVSDTNILTNTNQGTNADFFLNGIEIQQSGNVVNSVIPGVTFSLLGKSAAPVTLSLQSDPSQLSSALTDFVGKYNALQSQISQQIGPSAGALAGDTVVNQLETSLRQLTSQISSTGTVQSLSDLGITFDSAGKASFDSTAFASLTGAQVSDAFKFIGSTTTGIGGFSQTFSQFADPITGLIQAETSVLKSTDQDLQNQISSLNTRISLLQSSLTKQFEAADAQQAELQQQQTNLTASLQAVSLVLYGRNNTQF